LRRRAALPALPIPRRRRLAAPWIQGRHREIRLAPARRRAEPDPAPRRRAGAPAAPARRAPGLDLRKPARHRPPVFRDRGGERGGGVEVLAERGRALLI